LSPCESCHAGCCRSFAVPVSGADILGIERQLGLNFWQFVCRWADPRGTIARDHAPQFHFEDEPETPFVICLLQSESAFMSGTQKCRFLVECEPDGHHPLGQARCGIYRQRPATCRAFPAKMDEDGQLAVLYEVPANGRADDNPLYSLCSRPWTPDDLDPLQTPQDLVVAAYEMAFFHRLAQIWNRSPRSWQIFPEFLRLVYAQRIVSESRPTPTATDALLPLTLPIPPAVMEPNRKAA
jgi:Fe-S-cluster containining protein